MTEKTVKAAREGWFTLDPDAPALLASRCTACRTLYFPPQTLFCRNPACDGETFETAEIGQRGRIWSVTDACYAPPPPFVAKDPHRPFAIAAVELPEAGLVVLGQLVEGVGVDDVRIGDPVELVLATLFEDDDSRTVVWKWQPVAAEAGA